MHFIYLQHSGKPLENSGGQFWVVGGVALPEKNWKVLNLRLNGLQKSFQGENYDPKTSILDARKLLHPKTAERRWTQSLAKGLEKIVAGLQLKFFLVVVDKKTTDKPAHPRWLMPLSYSYLIKPVTQYLREVDDTGAIVIPPGRPDEAALLTDIQNEHLFTFSGRQSPLISTPIIQSPKDASGLQVADMVATIGRVYHETVFPKLFAKQVLEGYDALMNSHYQGFVKPNTYQSPNTDAKGYRIRGYIYLWRRDQGGPGGHSAHEASGVGEATPRPALATNGETVGG